MCGQHHCVAVHSRLTTHTLIELSQGKCHVSFDLKKNKDVREKASLYIQQ